MSKDNGHFFPEPGRGRDRPSDHPRRDLVLPRVPAGERAAGDRHRPRRRKGHRRTGGRVGRGSHADQPGENVPAPRRGRAIRRGKTEPHDQRQRAGGGRSDGEDPGDLPGAGPLGEGGGTSGRPPRTRPAGCGAPCATPWPLRPVRRTPGVVPSRKCGARSRASWTRWGCVHRRPQLRMPTRCSGAIRAGAPRVEELARLGPLPGQCGFVVTHGPRIVGAEIFGAPELLKPHWAALVRSYLLEEPTATGWPSPGRVPARPPGHQPGGVEEVSRPRARSGTSLHQREGGRPGAHPGGCGRPHLGPQSVARSLRLAP